MSWQDELRRLDAELANGTITQHQHRKMRDELLAAASGNVAPASVASPRGRVDGAPQWQSANPAAPGFTPQPGQAPWPPHDPHGVVPPHWGQGHPPQGQQGQITQPVGVDGQPQNGQPQGGHSPADTGHGQVPPGPAQGGQPQAGQSPADAGLGQVPAGQVQQPGAVQGQQPQPGQPEQRQQPQPGQSQQGQQPQPGQPQPGEEPGQQPQLGALATEEGPTQSISAQLLATDKPTSAPSPADERATDSMRFPSIEDAPTVITNPVPPPARALPSMAPPPPLHAPRQQPMPFDPAPRLQAPPKRKPTWLFITLGVVVVIAMVAAGVWFLRDQNTTATTTASANSAASSPEAVEARLPTLPGTPSSNNGTLTVDQGIDLKLYSREEGQLFKDNGAGQVIFRGSAQGPQGYLVLVVPAGSPAAAATITRGLYEHSLSAGLQTVPSGSTDAKAVTGSNSAGQMSGTWYTSGSYAVAIWVSQGLDGDPAALAERLAQTKTSLATALPPN
ncbi:hypothetical protein [Amycolatopsis ruanii]|uniref:hypothetical protein n=1 Tax=Amycolatopsis ruanii TaxID=944491 RepID=UPI001966E843|nr:hypothetical protein [Amycolatopsis ruanii]